MQRTFSRNSLHALKHQNAPPKRVSFKFKKTLLLLPATSFRLPFILTTSIYTFRFQAHPAPPPPPFFNPPVQQNTARVEDDDPYAFFPAPPRPHAAISKHPKAPPRNTQKLIPPLQARQMKTKAATTSNHHRHHHQGPSSVVMNQRHFQEEAAHTTTTTTTIAAANVVNTFHRKQKQQQQQKEEERNVHSTTEEEEEEFEIEGISSEGDGDIAINQKKDVLNRRRRRREMNFTVIPSSDTSTSEYDPSEEEEEEQEYVTMAKVPYQTKKQNSKTTTNSKKVNESVATTATTHPSASGSFDILLSELTEGRANTGIVVPNIFKKPTTTTATPAAATAISPSHTNQAAVPQTAAKPSERVKKAHGAAQGSLPLCIPTRVVRNPAGSSVLIEVPPGVDLSGASGAVGRIGNGTSTPGIVLDLMGEFAFYILKFKRMNEFLAK